VDDRPGDKGVLTDLCLKGVLTDLCLTLYYRAKRTENLEIESEEKVDADEKCPCVFSQGSGKKL
jgi:hypothetical protein